MSPLLLLALLPVLPLAAFVYASYRVARRPRDAPASWLARSDRTDRCVLCLGDSITHGHIGSDWVGRLRRRLRPRGVDVVNAGINGELAWNVEQRLDAALRVAPTAAVLLVGSNDTMGAEREDRGRSYQRSNSLPQRPDPLFYEASLRALLVRLSAAVEHVAVCTIPPLGELPSADLAPPTNEILRRVAADLDVPVLDVHAALTGLAPADPPAYDGAPWAVVKTIAHVALLHYVAGRSWDAIADSTGQGALVDGIHLSDRAGAEVLDLVEGWLEGRL